jgi:hypothetical protein
MHSDSLTREELYDLVWSTPLLTLSKKYDLSITAIKDICIRMNIPTPPMGHWVKLQWNKEVLIVPLPEDTKADATVKLPIRGKMNV